MTEQEPKCFQTHDVSNQSKPLANYNLFSTNIALQEAVVREGGGWAITGLKAWGEYLAGLKQ